MSIVNTGLGWECPSEYLVYDANTDLGYAASRHFYKTNDGYAFAFFSINTAGWRGPVVVSTVPGNVEHYYDTSYLGPVFSFQHLRKTWYVGNLHHMNTNNYSTGVLVPIETTCVSEAEWLAFLPQIMNQLGVKPYISWRGISFAAGLSAGMASRVWAYMGEVLMGLIHKVVNSNGIYRAAADNADGYDVVSVNVPNTYESYDEGKVVSSGALVAQTTTTKTSNGIYDTTLNNSVIINVSNTYVPADEGKVVNNGSLINQSSINIGANGTYDTTLNNLVNVNVSNTYTINDEGKVVSSGALVTQSSQTISSNGSYDTTLFNNVIVNVPLANGEVF